MTCRYWGIELVFSFVQLDAGHASAGTWHGRKVIVGIAGSTALHGAGRRVASFRSNNARLAGGRGFNGLLGGRNGGGGVGIGDVDAEAFDFDVAEAKEEVSREDSYSERQ